MMDFLDRIQARRLAGHLMRRQGFRIRAMFRSLKGNSLPLVKYDILWALPMHFTMLYLRLFQREQGLTEVEIGTITSFQLATQIVGALCGGYLAERFGRLRTVTWVDGIVWPTTFLILTTAQGYLSFMLGALLMGSISLLVPSWISLFVEGTPESKRPHLFTVRQMPWFFAMLTVSLSGFAVRRWGVSQSCRSVFAFSAILTLFAVWYRGKFLKHTDPPPRSFTLSFKEFEHLALSHWNAFKVVISRRHMIVFLLMQILANAAMTTAGTFNYLYLTDPNGVALDKATIAIFPIFQGVTTLVVTFLILPYMTGANIFRTLFVGVGFMALSATILLMAPKGALAAAIVAYMCGSTGFALYNPSLASYWSNLMSDRERARIIALSTVIILLFITPVPTIAGGLYEINARGPLFMIFMFHLVNMALIVWAVTTPRAPKERLAAVELPPGRERVE